MFGCAYGHFPTTSYIDAQRESKFKQFKEEIKASEQGNKEGFIKERGECVGE